MGRPHQHAHPVLGIVAIFLAVALTFTLWIAPAVNMHDAGWHYGYVWGWVIGWPLACWLSWWYWIEGRFSGR